METLLPIKKELQTEQGTHIQVVSTSNFTHFIIVNLGADGLARPNRNAEMNVIKHEKVQRLSKKALQEYHQKGIEEAKRTYSELI